MVNVVLIIVMIIMFVVIVAASIYILVHFQHEADKNTAWFPKVLVIVGICLAAINILMLPLDVGNTSTNGKIPMKQLWLASYLATGIMVVILLPFAIFYYEAEDPDSNSIGKRIASAIKYEIACIVVFVILVVVLWVTVGTAEISFQRLNSESVAGPLFNVNPSPVVRTNSNPLAIGKEKKNLTFQVTIVLYAISILTFVGVFLFVFFGGVGLACLPMDLINSFKNRPKFISVQEYDARKGLLGEQAAFMFDKGMKLKERLKKKGGRPKTRSEKTAYRKFRAAVFLLEEDYEKLEKTYNKGIGPKVIMIALAWVKLFVGIIALSMSIVWIIHIIIYNAPNPPLHPFLNNMFIALDDAFGLLGTSAYGCFAFYLLWCVIAGCLKFGLRVPFLFSIHPMKVGATLMNSFMFNVLLLLTASMTVIQFCSLSFAMYNRLTSIDTIFNVGVRSLRGIKYFWNYYYLAMILVAILSIIYFVAFPAKKLRKDQKFMVR